MECKLTTIFTLSFYANHSIYKLLQARFAKAKPDVLHGGQNEKAGRRQQCCWWKQTAANRRNELDSRRHHAAIYE